MLSTLDPATAAPVEVLGEDAAGTLAFLVEQRRVQDEAAARELRAVAHWAELHRVDTRTEVGAVDREVWWLLEARLEEQAEAAREAGQRPTVVGTGLLGREGELRLAGEGAFTVAEFAVTELAAALGLSEPAAREYVGQAVELRDRLPRCWGQVMAGRLPAWKARRIARETIPLTGAAASYVDTQLAPFAARLSVTRMLRVVDAGITRHDPAAAADRARAAADHRGVWLSDGLDGTTRIEAVTGTPDAVAFDTAVGDVAATLAALGDADPVQVPGGPRPSGCSPTRSTPWTSPPPPRPPRPATRPRSHPHGPATVVPLPSFTSTCTPPRMTLWMRRWSCRSCRSCRWSRWRG